MKTNKQQRTAYPSNYYVATHWLHRDLVMCNNLPEVDPSIFDNARFSLFYYEDEEGNIYEDPSEYDGEPEELYEKYEEIFQYFITNFSLDEVEWMEEHFSGIRFTYSDLLDCFILCVTHFGTSWDYVYCDAYFENAKAEEGERLGL